MTATEAREELKAVDRTHSRRWGVQHETDRSNFRT